MFRRVLSALVIVLFGAVLLVAAWPQLLGIQRETGVVQATTMRGLLTAVALLGAVRFVLIALVWTSGRRFAGAVGLLLLFLPFYFRWFGGGDVKLAAVIGAWLGPQVGTVAILAALALGGLLSLGVALTSSAQTRREVFANLGWLVLHRRPFSISERPARERVPFAVALGVCAVVAFFLKRSAA